jgi:hypothetical protein
LRKKGRRRACVGRARGVGWADPARGLGWERGAAVPKRQGGDCGLAGGKGARSMRDALLRGSGRWSVSSGIRREEVERWGFGGFALPTTIQKTEPRTTTRLPITNLSAPFHPPRPSTRPTPRFTQDAPPRCRPRCGAGGRGLAVQRSQAAGDAAVQRSSRPGDRHWRGRLQVLALRARRPLHLHDCKLLLLVLRCARCARPARGRVGLRRSIAQGQAQVRMGGEPNGLLQPPPHAKSMPTWHNQLVPCHKHSSSRLMTRCHPATPPGLAPTAYAPPPRPHACHAPPPAPATLPAPAGSS